MITDGPGVVPFHGDAKVADDAGALLVRSGLVSASSLNDARARAESEGGTLGEQLVSRGALDDDALTDFYKTRLLVPQVNPNTLARLPTRVIATIPQDMAIELRVIPVSLDAENNLTVAMSDPSDRHAVDEIAFFTGTYVVRAVATQMQIAWCLAHYYGHVTTLGQKLLQPNAQPAVSPDPAVRPRTRGNTDKVEAMRHRAIAPGSDTSAARPSGEIAAAAPPAQGAEVQDITDRHRARSASGEIRARAQSIKEPVETADSEDSDGAAVITSVPPEVSGPVISIELAEPDDDPTHETRPAPARRRKAKTDPPELAARAGEIGLKSGPIKSVVEESSIVIADDLQPPVVEARTKTDEVPGAPAEAAATSAGSVSSPEVTGEPSGSVAAPEVTGEPSGSVVISEHVGEESAPIILDRPRKPSDAPTSVAAPLVVVEQEDDDVVVLNARKPGAARRPERSTQVGVGAITAATRAKAPSDAPNIGIPTDLEDQTTGAQTAPTDFDPTRLDARAAPPPEDYTPSQGAIAAPPRPAVPDDEDDDATLAPPPVKGAPPPSGQISLDRVVQRPPSANDDDDDLGPATSVMSAVELDDVIPERAAEIMPAHLDQRRIDYDPVDDGWGPPGTTIPPPLLGAIPGSDGTVSGMIPIQNVDSAPLMIAPPTPPQPARDTPVIEPPAQLGRALELAMQRVLDLIRALDQAHDRDEVVAVMTAYLAESHHRAGFIAARAGELALFTMTPRPSTMPTATLRLDRPSTLQDVVGTRLPYRGPMHDDASRTFLTSVFGACPPEILLVPITVRDRVVGVMFGEQRLRHTFDDQLSLAARAAGMALERILKAKK